MPPGCHGFPRLNPGCTAAVAPTQSTSGNLQPTIPSVHLWRVPGVRSPRPEIALTQPGPGRIHPRTCHRSAISDSGPLLFRSGPKPPTDVEEKTVGLRIVVCVKQVPDTKRITGEAMKDDGTVNRAALPAIFNPEDLNALEAALEIRDRVGGTVTVVTMGPPAACEMLREQSMFRGADRGVLVTDRRAAASDTLATSYILACAVRKLGADLVLCGRQAIDGDTAQVGPQLAEKLGLPLVTYVEELIDVEPRRIRAPAQRRQRLGGRRRATLPVPADGDGHRQHAAPAGRQADHEVQEGPLARWRSAGEVADCRRRQCHDAVEAEAERSAARPRWPRKGMLIEQWNLDDIEADLAWCGHDGSPTKVHRIQSVVLAGGEYREFAPTDDGIAELVGELIDDHTIG